MQSEFLGIDIGGTNTRLGLVSSKGKIVSSGRLKTRMDAGPRALVEGIFLKAARMMGENQIIQVGAGIAGLIDHRKGVIRFSPNLASWRNVPLKDMLEQCFSVPVAVSNDVNAIAWGEYKYGGYGTENLFCFTLGTGVGGGIISDGALILGANYAAGEFGHTSFEGNAKCSCGITGCLEAYVGNDRLVRKARRRMNLASPLMKLTSGKEITPRLLARAAREGDEVALKVFAQAGRRIGKALGNVVQLLDPEVIVVNGGVSKAGDLILKPIRETLKRYTMPLEGRKLRVMRSKLGDKAGILGAATLAEVLL
ncbi:ROK family protein [candidate division WOR-3 bacterium]|uniref:ROK family protein n=1 Tax=candidate division WOR-3 bacterium TaxID=2052148 RepID=A0A9D5K7K9_UNCW3|nr:ROK family protein [candidate division WOR-3 bacterium]MBD3363737.1 ROK family protein [candidate division WOR-3 bacterium]